MTDTHLIAAVVVYCALHSVMADAYLMRSIYEKWWYRFIYVCLSLLLLIPVIYIYLNVPKQPFFNPPVFIKAVLYVIWTIALLFGLYATKSYNNSHFLGLEQIRVHFNTKKSTKADKKLSKKGALAIVRHPYYTAGLVLIWARPMNHQDLLITIILTVYFIAGTYNEERKLIAEFGKDYVRYQSEVPALVPFMRRRHGK